MTKAEEVFENSPKQTRADVRHEIVPEIKVASRILKQPETVDKLREVSQKIKQEDEKLKGRHRVLRSPVMTPSSTTQIDDSIFKEHLDTRPLAPFNHNIFRTSQPDTRVPEGKLPSKIEQVVQYGTSSPVQQRIRRQLVLDKEPLVSSSEGNVEVIETRLRPQTWGQWFRKLLCC